MEEKLKTSIVENFKNTELGFLRIRRNLGIEAYSDTETEQHLKKILSSTDLDCIESKGKNHYFKCVKHKAILTVNAHSLTVITAKKINPKNNQKSPSTPSRRLQDQYRILTV